MNSPAKLSPLLGLVVIAVALTGAGISYHFTLESKFASLEQKLDQTTIAFQQYQVSQETLVSAKSEALTTLSKEMDQLQASMAPLGKATREQTDSLNDIHKQLATLQQSQQTQQDAEKKLAVYAAQLAKLQHDVQTQLQAQAPVPALPAVTPAGSSATTSHTSAASPLLVVPRVDSAIDLRPATTPGHLPVDEEEDVAARTFPVALPATLSTASR